MTLGIAQYISNTSTAWGGTAAASRTTASFTPAANAKMYVLGWNECPADFTMTVTDSLGNSVGAGFTQKADSGLFTNGATAWRSRLYLWEFDTGASPAARTITITATQSTGAIAYGIFAATGSSPQIKTGQLAVGTDVGSSGAGGDGTVTATLGSAGTNGNLVIAAIGMNKDSHAAIPTPTGFTVLFAPAGTTEFEAPGVFYRTDFTGTAVSDTNTGDLVDNSGMVLFEIEEGVPSVPVGILLETGLGYIITEDGLPIMTES